MAEGKWIPDLTGTTPVEEAAREALQRRLETIEKALAPSLDASSSDPEPVHQLRVGARRATVALDLFADCLPRSVYRKTRRSLRDLRRSAGEARDWDVFLLTLGQKASRRRAAGFLLGYAHGQRSAAQSILVEVAHKFSSKLSRHWGQVCSHLGSPPASNVGERCSIFAGDVNRSLAQTARRDPAAPEQLEELHRVRILGKELRYSMEIFSGCFRAPFREELYPRVEAMQEILGVLNDSRVACDNLTFLRARLKAVAPQHWRQVGPEVTAWLRYHQGQLKRQKRRFLQWLEQWQLASSDEEFEAMLEIANADRD